MTAFYENLLDRRQSGIHALQAAKVKMLREGAAPVEWAPFTLLGPP